MKLSRFFEDLESFLAWMPESSANGSAFNCDSRVTNPDTLGIIPVI
jgi:hypothetical protein